jgi:glycosyltransferase involved in cell wall biosynthesis
MKRPRVLVAQPYLGASGGGNVVAAWTLEALREEFDVALATLGPVDHASMNRNLGTSLREEDFTIHIAPRRYTNILRFVPTAGAQLEIALTTRWARELDARQHFDAVMSTQNEMDFGRPGVQYVHYPWAYLPRPEIELRWFHRIPGALAGYRGFCGLVSQGTIEGAGRNVSLANSTFVARKVKDYYGTDAEVVYPPVPGRFPDIPWEERQQAAVAVGRMNPCKRWEIVVAMVDLVRERGVELALTLINTPDDPEYGRRIARMAESRPWFRILTGLTREELAHEVALHRYGIHAMKEEHFGIAVAEMVRAGCIPFVHDSGGPVEIVGGLRELRFQDVADGAGALSAVAGDRELTGRLREALAHQKEMFSVERFCDSLREVMRRQCAGCLNSRATPGRL